MGVSPLVSSFYILFFYIDKQEYFNFFIFIVSTFFLAIFVLTLSLLLSKISTQATQQFRDKLTPYECGFLPYGDARDRFEVHFYLVALLFIVFDLEIILILPWALNTAAPGIFGLYVIIVFFFILGLGIIYE